MAYQGQGGRAMGGDTEARDVYVTWDPKRVSRAKTAAAARAGAARGVGAGAARAEQGDVRRVSAQMARDCLERTRAEVDGLARMGFLLRGQACATVCLLKGQLSDEERAGGELLGGPDGAALVSALAALGYPDDCWAAISTRVRTPGQPWTPAAPDELAEAVEVVDPELVIALDDEAAEALRAAYDVDVPLAPGEVARVLGRRFLALGGFADALGDPRAKQLMWARLKRVPPLGDPL